VVDSSEWCALHLVAAWQTQKELPGWKVPCLGNSGRRVDEASMLDIMGTEDPATDQDVY